MTTQLWIWEEQILHSKWWNDGKKTQNLEKRILENYVLLLSSLDAFLEEDHKIYGIIIGTFLGHDHKMKYWKKFSLDPLRHVSIDFMS